jgi:hypothetical protein
MPSRHPITLRLLITCIALLLAGCDIPGMGPDPRIAKKEADAKAIGSACRHGLRSIEDCYTLNKTASKADVFTGWKDMDVYMRENKIEGVPATVKAAEPTTPPAEGAEPAEGSTDKKPEAEAPAGAKEKPAPAKAKSAAKAPSH